MPFGALLRFADLGVRVKGGATTRELFPLVVPRLVSLFQSEHNCSNICHTWCFSQHRASLPKRVERDKFYTTLDKGEHNTKRHEINCLLVLSDCDSPSGLEIHSRLHQKSAWGFAAPENCNETFELLGLRLAFGSIMLDCCKQRAPHTCFASLRSRLHWPETH